MRLLLLSLIALTLAGAAMAQPDTPGVGAGHIGDVYRVVFADLGDPAECPARHGQHCGVTDSSSCVTDDAGANALCRYNAQTSSWESVRTRTAADCSAESGGAANELCHETGDDSLWLCPTAAAPCNAAGWISVGSATAGGFTPNADPRVDHSGYDAGTDPTTDLEEESHAAEHQHGGADEVGTATPAADAIPKADAAGDLADGWIPDAVTRDSELSAHAGDPDAHGEPREGICAADADCYWVTDETELQTAFNSAFGSGATAPSLGRWRFWSPADSRFDITDDVRACHDSDVTGAALPDCDADGTLLSGQTIEWGLTYACKIPWASRDAIRDNGTGCIWLGDAGDGTGTTDGFGIGAVTLTGEIDVVQHMPDDTTDLGAGEVAGFAFVVERPHVAQGLRVDMQAATQAEVEALGPDAPGCGLGLDCRLASGSLWVGGQGQVDMRVLRIPDPPNPDVDRITPMPRAAGPTEMTWNIVTNGSVQTHRPVEMFGAGNAPDSDWAGSDYHPAIRFPASSVIAGNGADKGMLTISDASVEHFGLLAVTGLGKLAWIDVAPDTCRHARFSGRYVHSTAQSVVTLDWEDATAECEVVVDGAWVAPNDTYPGAPETEGVKQSVVDCTVSGIYPTAPKQVVRLGPGFSMLVSQSSSVLNPAPILASLPCPQMLFSVWNEEIAQAYLEGPVGTVAPPVTGATATGSSTSGSTVTWSDTGTDFSAAGVQAGDVLVPESGDESDEARIVISVATNTLTVEGHQWESDQTGNTYKVVRPRCVDWTTGQLVACGSPASPTAGTAIRNPGRWIFHRLETEVLEDPASGSRCVLDWVRNGDRFSEEVSLNTEDQEGMETPYTALGLTPYTVADGPWAATKHVDLDDSTGDYLQAMLFDGAGGTCLEADRDIGRVLVRGAHAEMNIQVTP